MAPVSLGGVVARRRGSPAMRTSKAREPAAQPHHCACRGKRHGRPWDLQHRVKCGGDAHGSPPLESQPSDSRNLRDRPVRVASFTGPPHAPPGVDSPSRTRRPPQNPLSSRISRAYIVPVRPTEPRGEPCSAPHHMNVKVDGVVLGDIPHGDLSRVELTVDYVV